MWALNIFASGKFKHFLLFLFQPNILILRNPMLEFNIPVFAYQKYYRLAIWGGAVIGYFHPCEMLLRTVSMESFNIVFKFEFRCMPNTVDMIQIWNKYIFVKFLVRIRSSNWALFWRYLYGIKLVLFAVDLLLIGKRCKRYIDRFNKSNI